MLSLAANENAVLNNSSEQLPEMQGAQEIGGQMIAFAVLSFPKKHNFQTHTLLQNGVKGLLRRAGYETKPAGSYFRDFFSVGVLYVTQKDETPALLTLREILETFSACFLIARYAAETSWMLLFPQEGNESDFQNIFFMPSQIA